MGYNTVVFLLNDFMDFIARSPKTAIWSLTHPNIYDHTERGDVLMQIAAENGEPPLHPQALQIARTFHADDPHYFRAGGNCIADLKVVRYGRTKEGKNTVTLELPDWWRPKKHK